MVHQSKVKPVLWSRPELKQGSNISISDDFTREVVERRNRIYPIFKSIQHALNQKPGHDKKQIQLKQDRFLLNGSVYTIDNLDSLPAKFKPDALCTKTNNNITAFFQKGSPLSNHHYCKFNVGGETYNCAEQYLMAAKAELFGDHERVVAIKREMEPRVQKSLGGKIKNYNRETWITEAPRILFKGLLEKFKQNDELATYLLATDQTTIVETNPKDSLFGVGMSLENSEIWNKEKWKGKNIQGITLEKVRAALRE